MTIQRVVARLQDCAKSDEAAFSKKARAIRKLIGPGKTSMERGNYYMLSQMSVAEVKKKLADADIEVTKVTKTARGTEVMTPYM